MGERRSIEEILAHLSGDDLDALFHYVYRDKYLERYADGRRPIYIKLFGVGREDYLFFLEADNIVYTFSVPSLYQFLSERE